MIRAGKIRVNGKTASVGDEVSGKEDIIIDGQILLVKKSPGKKVLAFYKPRGVECSLSAVLHGFAVSGNILGMLEKVEAAGSDFRWFGNVGAPSLMVSAISVGGD